MTLVTRRATEVTDAAAEAAAAWVGQARKAGRPAMERIPAMSALTATSRAEPGSAGAVKAVSVISTGTVRIHPEHPYGTRKPLYWWLLTSRRWTPPRPINVYVIEHAKGLILFDTGQDRASVTDGTLLPRRCHRLPVSPARPLRHRRGRHPHRPARHARVRPRRRGHRDRVPPARGPHRRAARADRLRSCWSRPPNGPSWPSPPRSCAASCAATSSCRD